MTSVTPLDLDAIEAQARHWDHLIRDDPETTLALVAEVRRLRAQVRDLHLRLAEDDDDWAHPADYLLPGGGVPPIAAS